MQIPGERQHLYYASRRSVYASKHRALFRDHHARPLALCLDRHHVHHDDHPYLPLHLLCLFEHALRFVGAGLAALSQYRLSHPPEELVAFWACLHHFFKREVHICVASDQMPVQGFAILELDKHRVALCGGEQAQGKLDEEHGQLVWDWSLTEARRTADVLTGSSDVESAYTTLAIPWISPEADDVLVSAAYTPRHQWHLAVFNLQVNPSADTGSPDITLNDQHLDVAWNQFDSTHSFTRIEVEDSSQLKHLVDVVFDGDWIERQTSIEDKQPLIEGKQPRLSIAVASVDNRQAIGLCFQLVFDPLAAAPLQRIIRGSKPITFASGSSSISLNPAPTLESDDEMFEDEEKLALLSHDADFDYALEAEELRLLEREAENLQSLILTKRKAIASHLQEQRNQQPLQSLLNECDSLVCAARVVAQRICDKVGVMTDPDFMYAASHDGDPQLLIDFGDEKKQQNESGKYMQSTSDADRPASSSSGQTISQPYILSPHLIKTTTAASSYSLKPVDLITTSNPLVQALQIIAAALGLTALCAYVRRKCMSVRKRAERAADLEERRNARAYRRAARRAYVRKRWVQLMATLNCFSLRQEPRNEDYEEKRALILQDAFLEQLEDVEQAEKGEVMEAEIRELRHAHEIVESLIRVSEHQYASVRPRHDPPPPMVPLPYTPGTRSRASTHTLPSYTSESLPDYTSRPATLGGSSCGSVADGFQSDTGATSLDDEDIHVPLAPTSCGEAVRAHRYTPTSSVVDVSPRASEDTLGTMLSRSATRHQ
nr:hypothetical protein CFP56_16766 [Quercus suber]